jgi:hypothetical protein
MNGRRHRKLLKLAEGEGFGRLAIRNSRIFSEILGAISRPLSPDWDSSSLGDSMLAVAASEVPLPRCSNVRDGTLKACRLTSFELQRFQVFDEVGLLSSGEIQPELPDVMLHN